MMRKISFYDYLVHICYTGDDSADAFLKFEFYDFIISDYLNIID